MQRYFLVVKNTKIFQSGIIVMGDLSMLKNAKIFKNDLIVMVDLPRWKKYKDFAKWSHCNGWPTQVKNTKIFQLVKNVKIFQNGENAKKIQSGLIVMGNLPKKKI